VLQLFFKFFEIYFKFPYQMNIEVKKRKSNHRLEHSACQALTVFFTACASLLPFFPSPSSQNPSFGRSGSAQQHFCLAARVPTLSEGSSVSTPTRNCSLLYSSLRALTDSDVLSLIPMCPTCSVVRILVSNHPLSFNV